MDPKDKQDDSLLDHSSDSPGSVAEMTEEKDHIEHEDKAEDASPISPAPSSYAASSSSTSCGTTSPATTKTARRRSISKRPQKRQADSSDSDSSDGSTQWKRKAPRYSKTSQMSETISAVVDTIIIQMERSENFYREQLRQQWKERRECQQRWYQRMAEQNNAFNETMKRFMTTMTSMAASIFMPAVPMSHDDGHDTSGHMTYPPHSGAEPQHLDHIPSGNPHSHSNADIHPEDDLTKPYHRS